MYGNLIHIRIKIKERGKKKTTVIKRVFPAQKSADKTICRRQKEKKT